MALQNRCVSCDFVIEAPDELRGQETVCPNCDATNVLRAPEDVVAAEERERVTRDAERSRFLGSLERARGARPGPAASGPLAAGLGAGGLPIQAGGLAIQAARRLQDISVYLLGFAYLFLILSLVLALVLVVGTDLTVTWKVVSMLGTVLVGILLFVFLKFGSDAVRALADATELLRAVEHRLTALQERQPLEGLGARHDAGA